MTDGDISFGRLDGRVAVVTGATGGIGRATTRALLAAGAKVMMVARDRRRLEAFEAELGAGSDVAWVTADVTKQLEVADAREATLKHFDRVDLLVVTAGVVRGAPFEDSVPADWQDMIDVNLSGLLHATQAFADPLLEVADREEPADIVFIGAVGSHVLFPRFAVYNALSAAINQLARTLRLEYGPRGLRVHLLEPGFTATDFGYNTRDDAAAEFDAYASRIRAPLPPETVAALVALTAALPATVNLAELVVLPTDQG